MFLRHSTLSSLETDVSWVLGLTWQTGSLFGMLLGQVPTRNNPGIGLNSSSELRRCFADIHVEFSKERRYVELRRPLTKSLASKVSCSWQTHVQRVATASPVRTQPASQGDIQPQAELRHSRPLLFFSAARGLPSNLCQIKGDSMGSTPCARTTQFSQWRAGYHYGGRVYVLTPGWRRVYSGPRATNNTVHLQNFTQMVRDDG